MSDPFYRTAAWRELRAATLARQPVCVTRGCGRPSTHADHVIPRGKGGADALGNLRGMCQACHNRRSARGNAAPRAIGCDVTGRPLDPDDPWHAEKSLGAGASDRAGIATQSKFPARRGR